MHASERRKCLPRPGKSLTLPSSENFFCCPAAGPLHPKILRNVLGQVGEKRSNITKTLGKSKPFCNIFLTMFYALLWKNLGCVIIDRHIFFLLVCLHDFSLDDLYTWEYSAMMHSPCLAFISMLTTSLCKYEKWRNRENCVIWINVCPPSPPLYFLADLR